MALDFSANTSHVVTVAPAAGINSLAQGTLLSWAYGAVVGGQFGRIMQKQTLSSGGRFCHVGWVTSGGGRYFVEFELKRATTNLFIRAFSNTLATLGPNKWLAIALQWNSAGVNGDQKLWVGDEWTLPVEPSAYQNQQVGSGALGDDSAGDLELGNAVAHANTNWIGRIDSEYYTPALLTEAQMQSWFREPRPLVSTGGMWHLGLNGAGTQPDVTGNGHNGTVTGATVAAGPPLWRPRMRQQAIGRSSLW